MNNGFLHIFLDFFSPAFESYLLVMYQILMCQFFSPVTVEFQITGIFNFCNIFHMSTIYSYIFINFIFA